MTLFPLLLFVMKLTSLDSPKRFRERAFSYARARFATRWMGIGIVATTESDRETAKDWNAVGRICGLEVSIAA